MLDIKDVVRMKANASVCNPVKSIKLTHKGINKSIPNEINKSFLVSDLIDN